MKKARQSRREVDQKTEPPAPAARLAPVFFLFLFCAGAILRLLLCWFNPPQNAFDNHYEPIFLIMQTAAIPAKDACFQCYHPPVFYWISAIIGDMAVSGGMTPPHIVKLLQFVCCFYGIATLGVCYLILKRFPLSAFSSAIAFGAICFLPRHIYMSAMNSNDTISYLCVAISIYLTVVALERKLAPLRLALLSIALTVTVFTKYTAFAVLPAVLAAVLWAYHVRLVVSRKQLWLSILAVFALPLSVLGGYLAANVKHYHSPLPWNVLLYDPSVRRPRDPEPISFVSFKPWEDAVMPMLAPGKLHSFWTMLYSGMWFDTSFPIFFPFSDANGKLVATLLFVVSRRRTFSRQEPVAFPLDDVVCGRTHFAGTCSFGSRLGWRLSFVSGKWKTFIQGKSGASSQPESLSCVAWLQHSGNHRAHYAAAGV